MVIDKDKILDPKIGDSHKIDNMETIIEEEITDIKIIVEMIAETEEDKTLEESSVMITEAEDPHQEEMVTEDIIVQTQIKETEVDLVQK